MVGMDSIEVSAVDSAEAVAVFVAAVVGSSMAVEAEVVRSTSFF